MVSKQFRQTSQLKRSRPLQFLHLAQRLPSHVLLVSLSICPSLVAVLWVLYCRMTYLRVQRTVADVHLRRTNDPALLAWQQTSHPFALFYESCIIKPNKCSLRCIHWQTVHSKSLPFSWLCEYNTLLVAQMKNSFSAAVRYVSKCPFSAYKRAWESHVRGMRTNSQWQCSRNCDIAPARIQILLDNLC